MSDSKHIDELIKQRKLKQSELSDLAELIEASARPTVIMFVDLVDSTAMKSDMEPGDWLGLVYEFIRRCDHIAKLTSGTIVKRIGDEVMITFQKTEDSEKFINLVTVDTSLENHNFKIGLDFGEAYHFRFLEELEDDPYGTVVDRCARITKYATNRAVLCSEEYYNSVVFKETYLPAGDFYLKGLPKLSSLYARSLLKYDSTDFLKPLIHDLNDDISDLDGYRQVGRRISAKEIASAATGRARPFLARGLLNIPKLPYSLEKFDQLYKEATDKSFFALRTSGYLVDWEVTFKKFEKKDDYLDLDIETNSLRVAIYCELPLFHIDVMRMLTKGDQLRLRGVLTHATLSLFRLNYVELSLRS